jgi:hypothetical protein
MGMVASKDSLWVVLGGTTTGALVQINTDSGLIKSSAEIGWSPQYITASTDRIWISETIGDGSHPKDDPRQNSVKVFDTATGQQVATSRIADPGPIAANGAQAWVTSRGGLARVDEAGASSNQVLALQGGAVIFLKADPTDVIATLEDPLGDLAHLVFVDPAADNVQKSIESLSPLGPALPATDGIRIPRRSADGSDWVLSRIDGDEFVPIATLPSGTDVNSITATLEGSAWAWTVEGCAYEFTIATGALTGRSALLDPDRGDPRAIAATDAGAWLLDGSGVVALTP